jgi:hypothetical protein
MNTKASSLIINAIIVIAALALLMIVTLFFIKNGYTLFTKSNECTAKEGFCTTHCEDVQLSLEGCKQNEVCCFKPA